MKVTRLGGVYPYVGRNSKGTVVFFSSKDYGTVLVGDVSRIGHSFAVNEEGYTKVDVPGLGSGFRPVEIVLESEDEVACMRTCLSRSVDGFPIPRTLQSMHCSFVEAIDS